VLLHPRLSAQSPIVSIRTADITSVRQRDKVREPRIELGLSDHFPRLDPVELDSGCG
jgi:hypothetical protein